MQILLIMQQHSTEENKEEEKNGGGGRRIRGEGSEKNEEGIEEGSRGEGGSHLYKCRGPWSSRLGAVCT